MGYYSFLEGSLSFDNVNEKNVDDLLIFLYDKFGFAKEDFTHKNGMLNSESGELYSIERKLYDIDEFLIELKDTYNILSLELTRYGEETSDIEKFIHNDENNTIEVYYPKIEYYLNNILE